jgi:hypothetical protein
MKKHVGVLEQVGLVATESSGARGPLSWARVV